jgi:UDP-glucose 4-epimerase
MTPSISIWGATGFIGQHLVRELARESIAVTVLTRRSPCDLPFEESLFLRVVQVPDSPQTVEVLARQIAKSAVVFNLAGVSGAVCSNADPLASLDGNCRIQAMFIKACEVAGTRPHVVLASSRLIYGKPAVLPVPETAPLMPQSMYAAHKLCVENYHQIAAHRSILTYTVCRISNPYGLYEPSPKQGYGFISNLIHCGLQGQALRLFGDGRQVRDYVHISDVISVLRRCGSHPGARNELFNIGCGHGISIRDAALAIRELTGAPIVYSPWPDEYAAVESGDYVADIGKARSAVGFEPIYRFTEGLAQLIQDHYSRGCPTVTGQVRVARQQASSN